MDKPSTSKPREEEIRPNSLTKSEELTVRPQIDPKYLDYVRKERKKQNVGHFGTLKKKFVSPEETPIELPETDRGYAVYGTHVDIDPITGEEKELAIHSVSPWQDYYTDWSTVGKDHERKNLHWRNPLRHNVITSLRSPLNRKHIEYMESKGFDFRRRIGIGKYGEVWKVKYKKESETRYFASKVLPLEELTDDIETSVNLLFNEIHVLKGLEHQNIVTVKHVEELPDTKTDFPYSHICIFMELCDGTLWDVVNTPPEDSEVPVPLMEIECKIWLTQIAEGLRYLHESNVSHMDINPTNILFIVRRGNTEKTFKLTDFGISQRFVAGVESKSNVKLGSLEYCAPELWAPEPLPFYETKPCDIYALCSTLAFCLTLKNASNLLYSIAVGKTHWDNYFNVRPELIDLMSRMSTIDPQSRLTIEEVCKHIWCQFQHIP